MPSPVHVERAERILQRLDWQVIRRLDGILQGDYRSLFYGFGLDLADLREYQPGDDVRHIDWNVTARLDTPYVRQYHRGPRDHRLVLARPQPVDGFRRPPTRLKRDRLVDFVTVLARLLTRRGNRVGAILYDSRVERVIPARGGRMHVLRLINDLLKQPPLPAAPFTDLGVAAASGPEHDPAAFADLCRVRFLHDARLGGAAAAAEPRHEVLAVRLSDPARGGPARRGHGADAGRRDRRAALRGYGGPAASGSATARRPSGTRPSWIPPCAMPAWIPCRSRPRTTWCAPWSRSPRGASSAAARGAS